MLGSYLFNKIAIGLNNGLDSGSGEGVGSDDHVSVHGGEYLGDGDHQTGLDAIEMSICRYFKFANSIEH